MARHAFLDLSEQVCEKTIARYRATAYKNGRSVCMTKEGGGEGVGHGVSVCVPHDSYLHTKHGVYTARNLRDGVAVLQLLGAETQCTDGKINQTSTHING